jgi:hypothetical protein
MRIEEILQLEERNEGFILLIKKGCFYEVYERSAFKFVKNICSIKKIIKY